MNAVEAVIQHGWSRNVPVHQIESGLYRRQGKAVSNFDRTLPSPLSDLAREITKDPYNLRAFLLELGVGFAFVGSQYPLRVGGEDFRSDLLFYHLKLRCYVVVDLKLGAFRPEFAGKMNFYLSAVNDCLRHPDDQPSIGIILCEELETALGKSATAAGSEA